MRPTHEEIRSRIVGDLILLSDVRWQWNYELTVPIADVPAELFETVGDLLELPVHEPDVLNEAEQEAVERIGWALAKCEVELPIGLIELQQNSAWQGVMDAARQALLIIAPDVEPATPKSVAAENPIGTWEEYFAAVEKTPLHPLYAELDKYLPSAGEAFELACGLGKGARHLAEKGLEVWATDVSGEALTYLYKNATKAQKAKLHLYLSSFETLDLAPDSFDVFVAAFCLFFMTPEVFAEKWPMIVDSIRPDGLFVGQFMGENDDWASMGCLSQTREQVDELLGKFEILHFEEADQDGKTSQGTDKHWHIFHVIARKRVGAKAKGPIRCED